MTQDPGKGDFERSHHGLAMYARFAAMILTSMVVMYVGMFAGAWEWDHVRFSQSRIFMAATMGGTMGLVMLTWMLGMYRNVKGNIVVIVISLVLIGGGIALDRSQITVDDTAFMRAMIPHHSMAITRAERFQNEDARVGELAVEISKAQRREIEEMDWLIRDIEENGVAATVEDAAARPVPVSPPLPIGTARPNDSGTERRAGSITKSARPRCAETSHRADGGVWFRHIVDTRRYEIEPMPASFPAVQ